MLFRSKEHKFEYETLQKLYTTLEQGSPARSLELSEEERAITHDLFLLTDKPILYVANIAEEDLATPEEELPLLCALKNMAAKEHAEVLKVSVKVEEELSALEAEEKAMFIEELGMGESGIDRLIRKSYELLGLISYLTAGSKEVRAWTITRGTKAPQAAGKIHSDFERGFIRAEIIAFDALQQLGGDMTLAKEKGLIRLEGKEYVIQDGDVVVFRFNV